jgi:hypothetical protein
MTYSEPNAPARLFIRGTLAQAAYLSEVSNRQLSAVRPKSRQDSRKPFLQAHRDGLHSVGARLNYDQSGFSINQKDSTWSTELGM